MKSVIIRGGMIAAIATFVALYLAPELGAQQAALNPALVAQGAWSATATYHKDDLVIARGSTWRALTTSKNKVPGSTTPNNSAFWQLFARGFNPLGAWVSTTTYEPDDLVTSAGQTYRAKLTSRNKVTTNVTYWEVFAAKGASGPNTGISDGTTGAPSISFTGDTGTGIYSPGGGKIALTESGQLFLHNIGTANTALGAAALTVNSSGQSNNAFGSEALSNNIAGSNNVGVGSRALFLNTSGNNNIAIGSNALNSNGAGAANIAIGGSALSNNNGSDNSVAVGFQALHDNLAGPNVGMGLNALFNNQLGTNNTAIGSEALANGGTNISSNTAIGFQALFNASGDNNIAIGDSAGANATAPTDSIFIGNGGDPGDTSIIRIGKAQAETFIAGIVGKTTQSNDAIAVLIDSNGQLGTVSSSRRYKYDIETMADASAMLAKLRPVTFRYKQAQNGGAHPLQYGLIAEEVADAFPDLVVFKDQKPETVKYHLLPTFLLAGYQAQQKTIAALTDDVRQQKETNAVLEARLRRLEALLPKAAALQ